MGEELTMIQHPRKGEQGFVLATSLVMLSLLTLMAVAMFFTGRTSTQVSSSAQHSTEGYYYAETAVNYMIWAMRNDAEFDGYDFRGSPVNDPNAVDPAVFPPLSSPASPQNVGDWSELMAFLWNPGPTDISDTTPAGLTGQLMYFDNTPISDRESRGAIVWPLPTIGGDPVYPTLFNISLRLPRYIRLDIDSSGIVTPSIPALPHQDPSLQADIPENGAIVWLTGGDQTHDFEYVTSADLAQCSGSISYPAACERTGASTGAWLQSASVVVYAIGYVGWRPSTIIRAQIK